MFGHPKTRGDLRETRIALDVPFLVLPLSEAAKDFAVSEAEGVLRTALHSGINNPRTLGTVVLDAWLKAARGSNSHEVKAEPEARPPAPFPAFNIDSGVFVDLLERSIAWHRDNQTDPYGIDRGVMAALTCVVEAWKGALR